MEDLRYTLGLDGSKFDGVVTRSMAGVGSLTGALAALGATGAFVAVIKRGFQVNQLLSDGEKAVAAMVQQFKGLNAEAAKNEAAAAMKQIKDLAPTSAATLTQLADGFLATLSASQTAGLSVQQNIDLVGRFANAMGAMRVPAEQLAQEMRSIISANIGSDSTLARNLGITNEMIGAAREAGQLYEFLAAKIGKLGEATDNAQTAFSSLEDAIDAASAALSRGLFVQAIDGSKGLTAALNDNLRQLEDLGSAIALVGTGALNTFKAVNEILRGLGATSGALYDMWANGTSAADAFRNAQEALNNEIYNTAKAADEAAGKINIPSAPDFAGSGKGGHGGGASDDSRRRRAEDIALARDQIMAEVAIAEAAARGHDKKAAALQREIDLRDKILKIIRDTGATEAQARELATRLQNAEEDKQRREEGKGRKIRSGRDGSTVARQAGGFGSLDDYYKLQQMREVGLDERAATRAARGGGSGLPVGQSDGFVPAFNDPLSGRGRSKIPARPFSGPGLAPALAPGESAYQRLQRGAFGSDALSKRGPAAAGDTRTHDLLRTTNEHLSRIRA